MKFWIPVLGFVTTWASGVCLLIAVSPRLLASWHGFLHTGIANRFPSPTLVPENPFFAGEPLPYYWFYQRVAQGISTLASVDLLHTFQAMSLVSLVALLIAGALSGRRVYRSTASGLVIGYLALVGLNPFGPAIAAAKYVVKDEPLLQHSRPDSPGDIFVTDVQADDRMAKPLLGALHFGTDWRGSQNVVWFFDVSSRAPALALLIVVAFGIAHPTSHLMVPVGLIMAGAVMAAFNPIIGIAAASALSLSSIVLKWNGRTPSVGGRSREQLVRSMAVVAGVIIAAPAYVHLVGTANPAVVNLGKGTLIKGASILFEFVVLVALARRAWRHAPPDVQPGIQMLTLSGFILIAIVPFVGLPEGNEHNLLNAASVLLAIPAACWVAEPRRTANRGLSEMKRAAIVFGLFLPVTACTVFAFWDRGSLPIEFEGRTLLRTPPSSALASFYGWVRSSTPPSAIFVTDPAHPIKMSGNVSEIPAFTHRALFLDQPSYLTTPYTDRGRRAAISTKTLAAEPLTAEEVEYLRAFGRPIFVVTCEADRAEVVDRMVTQFGQPSFRRDFIAVFPVALSLPRSVP